jgi:hypothetical protein
VCTQNEPKLTKVKKSSDAAPAFWSAVGEGGGHTPLCLSATIEPSTGKLEHRTNPKRCQPHSPPATALQNLAEAPNLPGMSTHSPHGVTSTLNQFVAHAAPSVTRVVKVFTLGAWAAVGVQVMMPWAEMLAFVTTPAAFVTESV